MLTARFLLPDVGELGGEEERERERPTWRNASPEEEEEGEEREMESLTNEWEKNRRRLEVKSAF